MPLVLLTDRRIAVRHIYRAPFQELPVDVLPTILAQLTDQRDWHSCTLVSRLFCRLATPFLYRTLDSRVISKTFLYHPSTTLLARPELARYVRHVTETGTIHRGMLVRYPDITKDTLAALSLCTNLHSMTWIDDSASSPETLLAFLGVVRKLPVRVITIRTHSDLGEEVWAQLISLSGLTKVALWCMEGPPRVLQGWAAPLGATLTHLELGRCAGVPPTILISVLTQLPHLQDLRIKGAPATAMPAILACLPSLCTLDTEYLLAGSGAYHSHRRPQHVVPGTGNDDGNSLPTLRHLTVRTYSMDTLGPQKLWTWIRDDLVPRAGLETFCLHAFAYSSAFTASSVSAYAATLGIRAGVSGPLKRMMPRAMDNGMGMSVPRRFLLDMGTRHGSTLQKLVLGDAQLTLSDVQCVCSMFTRLAVLGCALACADVDSIIAAIAPAANLTTLKLNVHWIPRERDVPEESELQAPDTASLQNNEDERFTLADARRMMFRSEDSKLRIIGIGHVLYTGKWVLKERPAFANGMKRTNGNGGEKKPSSALEFVVSADLADNRWKT